MVTYKPFSGWLLDLVIQIDLKYAGFAGHVLRASDERKHVIAAYLSQRQPHVQFSTFEETGLFLSQARHDNILAAAFDTPSPRMRAILARGGSQPYPPRYYLYVHGLLKNDNRRATQLLMRSLRRVNPTRLKIARALPKHLQQASLVELLQSVDQARDLARLVHLLALAGADEVAMVQALRLMRSPSDLRRFARRWSLRTEFPYHPAPSNENYTPVRNGEELDRMARTFRNCSRTYTAAVLEERAAFAIAHAGEHQAVVHLTRKDGVWFIDDFYGRENEDPDPKVVEAATSHLSNAGIHRAHFGPSHSQWACLRRLAGQFAPENW